MRHQTYRILASAAFAAVLGFGSSFAHAQDIAAELESLKSRIAELEARQARERGAAQQARAVDAAIVDADKKAAASAGSFTGGWENGFKIQSADKQYVLQPYVEFQFRNVTNFTDSGDGDDSNFVNGFEVRRAKVGLKGNAFTKDFSYNFRFTVDRSNGESLLDYAYGAYQFSEQWGIRFGQFKLNWTHEETSSDTKQLAAERSLLNQILGGTNSGYVQGVTLYNSAADSPFHGEFTFFDGDDSANTNFNDLDPDGVQQNFGVAARGEYKLFGDWKNYDDFTAMKNKSDLLVIGGGADWTQGGSSDVFRFTADGQYENTAGLGAYVAAIYTIAEGAAIDAQLDNSIGGLAQVGYMLPNADNWEIFGRYDLVHLDMDVGGEDNFHEVTVGLNKYFVGHNAKLTFDVGWLPNGTPESASGLGAANNTNEQIIVRTQIQLLL